MSRTSFKTNAVIICLLIIGAIAYAVLKECLPVRTGFTLFDLKGLDPLSIKISRTRPSELVYRPGMTRLPGPVEPELEFVKAHGDWQIIAPKRCHASLQTVNLALMLFYARAGRKVSGEPDAVKQFGLDKPSVTATLKTSSGKEFRLSVGYINPTQSSYFVRPEQGDVFLMSADIVEIVNQGLNYFRDRRVSRLNAEDVVLLNISQKIKFKKDPVSGWWIESPFRTRAKDEDVERLAEQISGLRISEFIDEYQDMKKYGLDIPVFCVEIEDKNGNKETILFGKSVFLPKRGFYIKRVEESWIYMIKSDIPEGFKKSIQDFRESSDGKVR